MNKKGENKIPRFVYYGIVIGLMFYMNFKLLPKLVEKEVVSQTYDQFITATIEEKVTAADILDKEIKYQVKGEDDKIFSVTKFEYGEDRELLPRLYENGVEIKRVSEQGNLILMQLVSFVLQIAFFVGLWMLLSRFIMKNVGGGTGPMNIGKSNAKVYAEDTEGITFDDVAGQEEAKEALVEIVDFLHNPKKYTKIGAKLPKGALLVGPPGTGKTLIARAIAGEAKVPFFSITGSDFVEMFVGVGAAKVRDLFQEANKKAPCIVFIDEIDTIGKRRDGSGLGGNDEREQTLNQLLSEMDGFDATSGVVILGATNRPDTLDPALLRPGRFDRRVPMELPDLHGREEILKVHLKKVRHAPDLDINFIARSTAGTSGADIANIVNEAALRAVKHGRERVETEDLLESVEVVIAGYQRKNLVIKPREKELIAYHEIGHALVAAKQSGSAPVTKITIVPRTSGTLGYTMQVDEEEKFLYEYDDAINQITTLVGGRAAEEIVFNTRTTGASNDIERATKLARDMVTRFGMNEKIGMVSIETVSNQYLGGDTQMVASDHTARVIDEEVRKIIESCHDRAVEILKENNEKLHQLSRFLLKEETITGEQFMEILED